MDDERDTGAEHLRSRLTDGMLFLTLNRPDARNAMTDSMLDALAREIAFAEESPDVRCVILLGAGKAFCAGGDVKNMEATSPMEAVLDDRIHWQRRIQRATAGKLASIPKPTLAVVNGPVAGAGLSLALACDLRLMSESAFMLTAFASVGLSGDFGATYFLTRILGTAKARELMFLSERILAPEALRLGLTNWTCEADELTERADIVARQLAAAPTTALGYMKENLNRAFTAGMDECLDLEATHHIHCSATSDHREGVAAFVERRPPRFGMKAGAVT